MSKDDILKFFQILYGSKAPGYLTICNKKDFRTKWIEAANLEKVSEIANEQAKDRDVYFGIGLRNIKLDERKRGTWQDILALSGLWLDVDIYYKDAHINRDLPKDVEIALNVLDKFKLKPTFIIHTGHGLNPLYLTEELWIFKNENELLEAKNKSFSFNKALINLFKENDYHLDNVGNIDRVIRVPYTTNFKANDPWTFPPP